MSFLDIVGSFIGGGGLATAVGTVAGAVAKYKERKLEMQHEINMLPHKEAQWRFETDMMRMHAEHESAQAERALLIESERGANDLLGSAIRADASDTRSALAVDGMPWWVGAIKTLFRPFLTVALWGLVLVFWARSGPDSAVELLAVNTVVQGAAASLGLWFGSRLVNAPRKENPDVYV